MASAVSLEYLTSLYNQPNGIPQLNGSGVINAAQLPAGYDNNYKGEYATLAALQTAHPTGVTADYAFVTGTGYYYWNAALTTPAWVSQFITATAYNALTTAQKLQLEYIIIP